MNMYSNCSYLLYNYTKAFLCGIWNLHREKLYPSGSFDLVLHSSIYQCVVNGSNSNSYVTVGF